MTTTVSATYRAPVRRSALTELTKRVLYFGNERFCPVCRSRVRAFKPYGHVRRADARCPVCDSIERHRFTWLFFEQRTTLFDGKRKRMLHVAPEPGFERRLRGLTYLDYKTADPQDDRADLKLDITAIHLPDDSFDVIHCSHVLEHIQEDELAMRELARVLSPSGWATILVPVMADKTFDDPTVTDPKERSRLFGQWDHVRAYGKDFAARLAAQGFDVETVRASDLIADAAEAQRMQLKDEELFFCRKSRLKI
jgi:SAM-dependent methyltransferase